MAAKYIVRLCRLIGMEARRSTKARVLVADDNCDAADVLTVLLQLEGYEVCLAYDGREALERFRAQAPHIAVLDIGMPQLDGYQVAREIRSSPGGKDVLLVALTGWGDAEDRANALAAGFSHHLLKPADPQKLLALLAR